MTTRYEQECLIAAGQHLRDALSTLTADNEHRGAQQGADVNWAAIYQARSALGRWDRTVKPIDEAAKTA